MLDHAEMAAKAEARYTELLAKLEDAPPKIKQEFKNVPKHYQRLYLEVHCGDGRSWTDSIRLKCLDCCCWQREEVSHCTVRHCGLWKLRPYKEKT